MKLFVYFLASVILIFAFTACGSSEPEPPEPVSFTIEMTEYSFTPSELTLTVGQEATLILVNKGQLEHEIMFGHDMVSEDGHPAGYTVDLFKQAGVEPMVEGGMLMIDGEMVMENGHDEEMTMEEGDSDHDEEMEMDESDSEHDEEMTMEGDVHDHEGLMVMLPKTGDTATMTFLVTEDMVGSWEIGCFELDGVHYDAGMKGTLTVKES